MVICPGAFADEEELTPEQDAVGEFRITMSSDYARLRIDGDEWENHEFLDNGRLVVIQGLSRTEEHFLTLTPMYPQLEPVEFKIAPSDWKLVTLSKRLKTWRVEQKIIFKKAPKKVEEPPAPASQEDED